MGSADAIKLERLLNDYISSQRSQAFAWGSFDCALFAANWVKKVKQIDYAVDLRGTYTTKVGAKKALRQKGFKFVDEYVDLFFKRVPCSHLKKGDLVLHEYGQQGGRSIGICAGVYSWFVTLEGLTAVRTMDCADGWALNESNS